jgi:alpha-L-fucosidase
MRIEPRRREAQTIAPDKLINLTVDILSKNGNLLPDVGREADWTIPAVQMERLKALGEWLARMAKPFTERIPGSARKESPPTVSMSGSRGRTQSPLRREWATSKVPQ